MQKIFGICMLFSPKSPNSITLGQGDHENGPSYVGHSENEILGETPLNMTWKRISPVWYAIFLYASFSFCREPWQVQLKSWNFLLNHTFICSAGTPGYEWILGTCTVAMGKISNKSVRIISFFGVISIQKKCSPHSAAPHEFTKV